MKALYRNLKEWGIPTENIHFEFFGPAGQIEEPEAATVQI
jgi:nitric oxide dioxygenase